MRATEIRDIIGKTNNFFKFCVRENQAINAYLITPCIKIVKIIKMKLRIWNGQNIWHQKNLMIIKNILMIRD